MTLGMSGADSLFGHPHVDAGLAAAQAGEMEAGEAVAGANAQHRLEPGSGAGIAAAEHGESFAIARFRSGT